MANATIITTFNGHTTSSKTLDIDFDALTGGNIHLTMQIEGEKIKPRKTIVYWEIESHGKPLDTGDLTMGQTAELIIQKEYAGSREKPHIFTITAKDVERTPLAVLQLKVFATPQITNAMWYKPTDRNKSGYQKIYEASVSDIVDIHIEGKGMYYIPLMFEIYREYGDREDELLHQESFSLENLFNDLNYKVNIGIFRKELSFYLTILNTTVFSIQHRLAMVGKLGHQVLDKLYFTIKDGHKLLYNGKTEPLEIYFDMESVMKTFANVKPPQNITPVVVYKEEYFTQSYEPCKYEKINFVYGEQSGLVFDEKKSTEVRYPKHEISIIAGKDPNAQKLEIQLSAVDTKECQYNDFNKKYIRYKNEEERKEKEAKHHDHKNNTFGTDGLYNIGIFEFEKTESKLSFVPKYPYVEDNYLTFLSQFLFNGAEKVEIPINTCRYQKILHLNIYPDALWTAHLKYGYEGDYFYKGESLPLVAGIKELWEEARPYVMALSAALPGSFAGTEFLMKYLVQEAETIFLGLHAQYNNKSKTLDYTNNYHRTTQFIIYEMVALQLALEVLFIILSEGTLVEAKAAKYLQKLQKGAKWIKRFTKALDKLDMEIIYPAIAMNSACYYEKQDDGKMAFVVEHNVKADPLLGIKYEKTFTLGEMLKNRKAKREAKGNDKPDNLAKVAEAAGLDASLTLKVEGTIAQEYNVKINTLTGKPTVTAILGNYLIYNQQKITQREAISVFVDVDAKSKLKINRFTGELKVKAKANGSVSHSRSYGKDEHGIWMQDSIELSEIKGEYMMRAKAKVQGAPVFDTNPEETPVPFIAFDKRTVDLPKVYLLKV